MNPHHVKKSKELDDNNPNKNDRKDPKTIAALVNEGRFSYPYIPTGIYAEIRSLSNLRFQTQEELTRIKNRIARWFAIYFPEYKDVYGDLMAVSGRMILKEAPLPEDIRILGVNGVNQIWRNAKLRGTGMKRAKILVSAAEHSVGSKEAPEAARIELKNLLNDMDVYVSRMEELLQTIEEKLKTIPYVDKLMEIKRNRIDYSQRYWSSDLDVFYTHFFSSILAAFGASPYLPTLCSAADTRIFALFIPSASQLRVSPNLVYTVHSKYSDILRQWSFLEYHSSADCH